MKLEFGEFVLMMGVNIVVYVSEICLFAAAVAADTEVFHLEGNLVK